MRRSKIAGRLNLLQTFALLSLLSIAVLSLALGAITSGILTSRMIAGEWAQTAGLVSYQVRVHRLDRIFTDAALRADRARVREELGALLSLPEIVRVKVWDRDGAVLWSDEERLIGRKFPENRELREALSGRLSVQLKPPKKPENVYDAAAFSALAEIYVPVVLGGARASVVGVMEIYKTPTRLFAEIRSVKAVIWTTSLLGGAVVYLSLFWLVRAAYRKQLGLERKLDRSRLELEVKSARNAELDSFVYAVSHDLKAPLVTIQGLAGMLRDDEAERLSERGQRYLERIGANVEQMERLIGDLLAFSRVGREGRPAERVAVNEVVDEVLATLHEAIRARGVKATCGDLGVVSAVRTQLHQVFSNLLSNAVKYLGDAPAPQVEIGCARRDGVVEYWVQDNGVGIDPAYHGKIFEVFQRLKDVEAAGSGVGLAIVKKIVEGAGGRIWVESARGQGATFRFTWPAEATA